MIQRIIPGLADMADDPHRFLPLRPVEFLVLLALANEPRHGYALTQDIAERTDGDVQLEPGNLYKILRRLEADGLIETRGRHPVAELASERRRYYALTPFGARVAMLEARRLRKLLASRAARDIGRLARGAEGS